MEHIPVKLVPFPGTKEILAAILKALDSLDGTSAQKLAALEAAISVVKGDQHAALDLLTRRELRSFASEGFAARPEVVPTLEEVVDDAIAHDDARSIRRLLPDLAKQEPGVQVRILDKIRAKFGNSIVPPRGALYA